MNYYIENNLENSLPKIFGSSGAMSLEDYYCEKTWEVVMQDGCGNEIMNVNNCNPSHSKIDCSKMIPDIPTTPPTTAGPTAGPTVGPTSGPPVDVDKETAFFLDYLRFTGDINFYYRFQNGLGNLGRYDHEWTPSNTMRDLRPLYFDRNNNPIQIGDGTGFFHWESHENNFSDIKVNPLIFIAIAHPGMRYERGHRSGISDIYDDWLQGFYIDDSLPAPENNVVNLKIYAEINDGTQSLVADKSYSFCANYGFRDDGGAVCAPFLMLHVPLQPINYWEMGARVFRLELSCDLGTDIIYISNLTPHPQTNCRGLPVGGPYPDNGCDYEVINSVF